jgi:hypothetical protein
VTGTAPRHRFHLVRWDLTKEKQGPALCGRVIRWRLATQIPEQTTCAACLVQIATNLLGIAIQAHREIDGG